MHSLHFVAVNIRSAHNVGSLFRTADALGVANIWLTGYTPTPANPQVQKRMTDAGVDPVTSKTPEEFKAYIEAETAKWSRVVKATGAKPE